jgi:hypothetical protein
VGLQTLIPQLRKELTDHWCGSAVSAPTTLFSAMAELARHNDAVQLLPYIERFLNHSGLPGHTLDGLRASHWCSIKLRFKPACPSMRSPPGFTTAG